MDADLSTKGTYIVKRFAYAFLVGAFLSLASCGQSEKTPDSTSQAPSVDKPASTPSVGTGIITGEVKFVGTPPQPKKIIINKDNQVCGNEIENEELVVGPNGGIEWAVVSVVNPGNFLKSGMTLGELTQKGCRFSPHVRAIAARGQVDIINPDGVLHNLHTYSKINPPINKAQPGFKKIMNVSFEKPEIFRIGCDAHSWMSGWIVVVDHPFVSWTDKKGSFKIEGVPVGKYTLKVWHETLGELVKDVEVKDGQEVKVVFKMSKK